MIIKIHSGGPSTVGPTTFQHCNAPLGRSSKNFFFSQKHCYLQTLMVHMLTLGTTLISYFDQIHLGHFCLMCGSLVAWNPKKDNRDRYHGVDNRDRDHNIYQNNCYQFRDKL